MPNESLNTTVKSIEVKEIKGLDEEIVIFINFSDGNSRYGAIKKPITIMEMASGFRILAKDLENYWRSQNAHISV